MAEGSQGSSSPCPAPSHPPPLHHHQIMLLETARRYNHETECITFLKDFTYSKDDFHRAGMAKCRLGSGVPAGQETQGLSSLFELPSVHIPDRVRAERTHLTVRAKSTVRLLSPDSAHGAGCDRGVCAVK